MKKYFKTKYFVGLAILLAGCTDFLDTKQYGSVDEAGYYKTPGAGLKVVMSCYTPMLDNWAYSINRYELGNNITDDADVGGSDAGDRPQVADVAKGRPLVTNSLLSEAWASRFTGVGICNSGIDELSVEGLVLIDDNSAVVSEGEKSRYISEMKFLRAWYNFDLVSIFGEVPLLTTTPLSTEKNKIKKATIAEIREQILSDINDCINNENVPLNTSDEEFGRVSRYAAYAFKARVCLFFAGLMEQGLLAGTASSEYASARDATQKVVESGEFELVPDFQELFRGNYLYGNHAGEIQSECIFTAQKVYDATYMEYTYATPVMEMGRNLVGGYGGGCVTEDLANEFEDFDPRKLFTIIAHGDTFYSVSSENGLEPHNYTGYYNFWGQQSRKFFVPDVYRGGYSIGDCRTNWLPYHIRYADVLLMYAEALYKTGGDAGTICELINTVRKRAFITTSRKDAEAYYRKYDQGLIDIDEAYFDANLAVKATDDLLAKIKHERRVELACEGLRFTDLLRWGDYVSTMTAYYAKYPAMNKGMEVSNKSWPFPIPQSEIDRTNGTLVQHDNY